MRQKRIKSNLRKRAEIIRLIRMFFLKKDYLEVETPSRIPAPIPEAYIDVVDSDGWCLHASPEICMKQLLAADYEKIYQITHVFRKGERGQKHLPELTMLEWYTKGHSYIELMDQLEELMVFIILHIQKSPIVNYQQNSIDIGSSFERMTVELVFEKYSDISMEKALYENTFDEIMGIIIEPCLGFEKPVFLYDYPAEKASLARLKASDKKYAERFELYIAGLELCNGFSELIDSFEQRQRFLNEQKIRKNNNKKTYPLPERFLKSMETMPPAAGIAFGIDRFVMLLTDSLSIDDVVAFTPEELVND